MLSPRLATEADADLMTQVLVDAFHRDPMWTSWAFPDRRTRRESRRAVFAAFVTGALRYSASWIAPDDRAVAVWIPPGGVGLSPEQELRFDADLRGRLCAEDAERILEGLSRFEKLEPSEPHYYLSLLGTDPSHAGAGHGRELLRHNLGLVDAEGAAAYLDCVDARVPLYEQFGFEVIGSFVLPDGPRTNGMWRPARDSS